MKYQYRLVQVYNPYLGTHYEIEVYVNEQMREHMAFCARRYYAELNENNEGDFQMNTLDLKFAPTVKVEETVFDFEEKEPVVVMDQELRSKYNAITQELGISQPGIVIDTFKAFLKQLGLRIYNNDKVEKYLTQHYGPETEREGATWGWRVLCAKDYTGIGERKWLNGKIIRTSLYSKPIPYPVLLTVQSIHHHFPEAQFFVSDELEASDFTDPFLMVQFGSEKLIIERWDEPAYRE